MSDKERNIGFVDKVRLWIEKKKPSTSKHALTGASYKLEDVSPFAIDFSGAPVYKKTIAGASLILCFIIYWFWYGWVNESFIDYALLEQMTWGAFFGGMLVIIIIIAMLIDLHKGSFTPYKRILELRLRSLARSRLKRVELKFEFHHELYSPHTGGYWRNLETSKATVEEADRKGKLELADIEKAFKVTSEVAKVLHAKDAETEALKAKVAELEEAFVPVKLDDEEMPFAELEGKRFHSIRDMKKIIDMALKKSETVRTKDEIKGVLGLKRRFVDLAEKIRLPFFVTLGECDSKGGRIYPLLISEHSLFGGSGGKGKGSFVEFREHTLAQRTWAGFMSKENVRAGVGEGVEIGMYKFYELIPDEFALLGKKEEKMRFAPIIFITASDAQAEKMIEDFRYNATREGTVQQDLIDASVIYDSSVADGLFETLKLVVSRLKRKERSEEEARNDMDYEIKDTISRGLEKSLIVEKSGKTGIFRNIKLFSKQTAKYFFYGICVIGALFFFFYLLHYYGGIDIGWIFGDGAGNETVTDDPWGNIVLPLWSVIS